MKPLLFTLLVTIAQATPVTGYGTFYWDQSPIWYTGSISSSDGSLLLTYSPVGMSTKITHCEINNVLYDTCFGGLSWGFVRAYSQDVLVVEEQLIGLYSEVLVHREPGSFGVSSGHGYWSIVPIVQNPEISSWVLTSLGLMVLYLIWRQRKIK